MNKKEPLFHIVKRNQDSKLKQLLIYVIAVALALAIGAVLLARQGVSFKKFYTDVFTIGIIGNKYPARIVEGFIRLFVPLLITSLALAVSFKMRFWNIGGEGQFIIGALFAGITAFKLGDTMPQLPLLVLMIISGILGGGIYGLIAAVLKVRLGTNETLMTLMLNYIALYLISFLGETKGDWNFFLSTTSARPIFAKFPANAAMITFPIGKFNLNLSLIVALLICVLIFIYMKYTKHGYEISVVGDSPNSAHYAGMKVNRIVIRTVFLSAALIGMAGAMYASSAGTLSTSITNDVGWTGVVVAWLAKLNTVGIFFTSFLITILQYGCQAASTAYPTIDVNFADMLQGVILFIVLAADFFTRFKIVFRSGKENGRND